MDLQQINYKQPAIIIGCVALILSAVFIYIIASHSKTAEAKDSTPVQDMPKQVVSVVEITKQSINMKKELPGRITAYRQAQIRPQVDGIIMERLFEEGTDVEKGQQLYQIDDARYNAALNSARADLKSAQASAKSVSSQAKRYDQLVKIEAVSKQEYDDAMAALDQANASIAVAKAAVDVAQVNLDYTKVYAPISGRISRSYVTEGSLAIANQDQQLATITQLDPIYIDMQQSGEEALKLRSRLAGQDNISVQIVYGDDATQAYPHTGTLRFSEVTVDETTGSITLRAQVPNTEFVLLPGLFVKAQIDLGEREAILVPQRATTRSANGDLSVWTVDPQGKAQKRIIDVEQAHGNQWVVSSGIEAGDTVIIEGYQKISEGQDVEQTAWNNAL